MSVKVLDGESLRETMDSRAQHYSSIREQFVQLRKAFQDIVDLDEFEGQGAEAIKGFYRGQIEVTEAWQRLIDRQIAFFEGVQGKLEDKSLGGNTRVETGFLKEELAHKERQADEMVSEQRKALHNIFAEIEDLVSLDPFSRDRFDSEMVEARKKRTDTLDAVEQTDQELLEEYLSSEGEEFYAAALFRALLDATKQGSNVSPIHFNATAYHTSDAYQRKVDAEAQTDAYLSFKKEEKEAREIANRPWYEDLWEGTKTFAGEFSGYYDYLRAKDGVDPVTGEELSAGQRVAAGAMAAAGFIPIVGWAGRAIKGGKGIYSATKAISAADHALDAYKSANAFSVLEKTEMGLYGLIAANGLSEYMTGKDMFGNELTDEQRHASLAQGFFAGLPIVPSMAREAASMGKGWLGDVKQHLSVSPKLVTENGIVHVDDAVKADSKVVEPVSREKDESLSLLSGRSDGSKGIDDVLKRSDEGFVRVLEEVLQKHSITVDEFNELRLKPVGSLTLEEIGKAKEIRREVPPITRDTMMQKILPPSAKGWLFQSPQDGGQIKVGGFLAKVADTQDLDRYDKIFEGLRLDYKGTTEWPNEYLTSDSALAIRFKALKPEAYKIPFGGNDEAAASIMVKGDHENDFIREVQGDPFTGNGFTKSESHIVPEYVSLSKVDLDDGVELYEINNEGEKLIAIYSEEDRKFISIIKR